MHKVKYVLSASQYRITHIKVFEKLFVKKLFLFHVILSHSLLYHYTLW